MTGATPRSELARLGGPTLGTGAALLVAQGEGSRAVRAALRDVVVLDEIASL